MLVRLEALYVPREIGKSRDTSVKVQFDAAVTRFDNLARDEAPFGPHSG